MCILKDCARFAGLTQLMPVALNSAICSSVSWSAISEKGWTREEHVNCKVDLVLLEPMHAAQSMPLQFGLT
eukprot:5844850-Amphidinium_carterae.1